MTQPDPNTAQAWIKQGKDYLDQGNDAEALTCFQQALMLNPKHTEAWIQCGQALQQLGYFSEAIDANQNAQRLYANPNAVVKPLVVVKPQQASAQTPAQSAKTERSEPQLVKTPSSMAQASNTQEAQAPALQFNNADDWLKRASALANSKEYSAAIASYDKALELRPADAEIWNQRGMVLFRAGQKDAAVASFDQARQLNPKSFQAWNNRASALADLGQYTDAIASYDQALQLTDHQLWPAWDDRGMAVLKARGYRAALAAWDQGIQSLQPQHPEYHRGCGTLYYRKGSIQYQEAHNQVDPLPQLGAAKASYLKALESLSFEQFPQQYLQVCMALAIVAYQIADQSTLQTVLPDALAKLQGMLQSPSLAPAQKISLERDYAGLIQVQVAVMAQQDPLEALVVAEASKYRCMNRWRYGWSAQTPQLSGPQIQTLLAPKTAVIAWYISPVGITTWVLRQNQAPLVLNSMGSQATAPSCGGTDQPLAAALQLRRFEAWFQQWIQIYQDQINLAPPVSESGPWRQAMAPVLLPRLQEILDLQRLCQDYLEEVDRLILIPHRQLHLLPLHTLFPQRFTVTYLPNAQIGVDLQTPSAIIREQLLSVEAPMSDGDNASTIGPYPDPFTALEAAGISHHYPIHTRLSGSRVTRARVLAALKITADRCHFTGDAHDDLERPLSSALVLTETQQLTLQTIWQLDLHRYTLVCLSACQPQITGQPHIAEEYVGLVSGFLAAGVTCVISSLWRVAGLPKALIMIRFHQLLKQTGDPVVALHQAQHWLRTLTHAALDQWCHELALVLEGFDLEAAHLLKEVIRSHRTEQPDSTGDQYPYADPFYWAGFRSSGYFSVPVPLAPARADLQS